MAARAKKDWGEALELVRSSLEASAGPTTNYPADEQAASVGRPTERSRPKKGCCPRCGARMPKVAGLRTCSTCGPPRWDEESAAGQRVANSVHLGGGCYRRLAARKHYRD